MELMNQGEFIEYLRSDIDIPEEELPSIEDDRFGTFPITNRGIQIWLFFRPHVGSDSVFQVLLPCRSRPSDPPVAISLALWESNYYRHAGWIDDAWGRLQLCQLYLRYQYTPQGNSTFEIDDSAILKKAFASSAMWPQGLNTGNTVTLSTTDSLCVKRYSCRKMYRFTVGFGHWFGQNWIHVDCEEEPGTILLIPYDLMLKKASVHVQSMKKARSGAAGCRICIMETTLPQSTLILQTSCVIWKSSRMCGVKLEVFRDPGFSNVSGEWTGFDVDGTDDPNRDWRGLMIPYCPSKQNSYEVLVDGVSMKFLRARSDIKLGDYGHFTDSEDFCCEGNLFAELKSLALKVDITPRQHKISERGGHQRRGNIVRAYYYHDCFAELYQPLGLSLPSNDDFRSFLVSLSV
ncbi:hypothetical protein SCLCIDRAFT_1213981 [Scleroderma citrinum Foug A]|uniref:Uncharacterized protein n=1 Tax=Scleroderma citrinum Foug A TaxID=1036808 RepID=A0A0C3E5X5_9AGAM|nr:hypothetical protein SCLCIDRAFT_1213981 [Scleroderma citrinum Foug A]